MSLSFQTFEFFNSLTAAAKKRLAVRRGVEVETVQAWGRPVADNGNPFASGKHNPLDGGIACLEMMHEQDPALARLAAEHFVEYVNELDRRAGVLREAAGMDGIGDLCATLKQLSPAMAQVVVEIANAIADGEVDEREKRATNRAVAGVETVLTRLKAQVGGEANR